MTYADERYDVSGLPLLPEGWTWGHQPEWHGGSPGAHFEHVAPGRAVLDIPGRSWPWLPEECEDATGQGQWLLDGQILVCRGCGLDST